MTGATERHPICRINRKCIKISHRSLHISLMHHYVWTSLPTETKFMLCKDREMMVNREWEREIYCNHFIMPSQAAKDMSISIHSMVTIWVSECANVSFACRATTFTVLLRMICTFISRCAHEAFLSEMWGTNDKKNQSRPWILITQYNICSVVLNNK